MKMLVAIRDEKTGAFLAPVPQSTPGEAERWYTTVVRTPGNIISQFPGDFPLYEVGTFDEFTGTVAPLLDKQGNAQLPRLLVTAAQLGPSLRAQEVANAD